MVNMNFDEIYDPEACVVMYQILVIMVMACASRNIDINEVEYIMDLISQSYIKHSEITYLTNLLNLSSYPLAFGNIS